MADSKQIRIDVREGEALTAPLLEFLNQYPKFQLGESIAFGDARHALGIAMYPMSGALVISETEDITGGHVSNRQYPFYLVYKAGGDSAARAISIKEFLEEIGRWCEEQKYETLNTTEIEVTGINRQTVAALESIEENGTENWIINMALYYTKQWQE